MAEVWAIVIVGALIIMVTAVMLAWRHGRARYAVIGVSIGAMGAAAEGWATSTLIVLVSLGLIVATGRRWARR